MRQGAIPRTQTSPPPERVAIDVAEHQQMSLEAGPAARILVVCTGNVCRSPMIERLLQRQLDAAYGPGQIEVASAGTSSLAGRPMDERSASLLAELGGSGDGFVARQLSERHIGAADLVLTATRQHRSAVVSQNPRALRRTFTVRELALLLHGADVAGLPSDPAQRVPAVAELARSRRHLLGGTDQTLLDVVDPFRAEDEVYQQVRAELAPAVEVIAAALTPG